MKIRTNSNRKPEKLSIGEHIVRISKVFVGKNIHGDSYLNIKFDNDYGYYFEKFYLQGESLSVMLNNLFKAAGINTNNGDYVDSKSLIGKSLRIILDINSYVNPTNGVISESIKLSGFKTMTQTKQSHKKLKYSEMAVFNQ